MLMQSNAAAAAPGGRNFFYQADNSSRLLIFEMPNQDAAVRRNTLAIALEAMPNLVPVRKVL